MQDITQVAARWNNPAAYDPDLDLDNDGDLDIVDLLLVAGSWNSVCGG